MKNEENKQNSLEKITIQDTVGYIDAEYIEVFKEKLSKIEEKAKDKGFSNIRIAPYIDRDGENEWQGFCISGQRLETNQEYHTRIYWMKQSCQRNIDNIEKIVANKEKNLARINELETLLSKISK